MLVLYETAAGFALFKVLQEGKVAQAQDLWKDFETADSASKVVKLKNFTKFDNTTEALASATAIVDGKLSKDLKKFLKKNAQGEELGVVDSKLGNIIKEKLGIPCIYSNAILELTRGIRSQINELISTLAGTDLTPMSLGLSHSLSRYKLKFSPDKVDTMIVQAIGLLDDLDKELNTYAMRVREWYGWHFPEMSKIVTDNVLYARTVKLMQHRDTAAETDFSAITMDEDVETSLKEAALISMGTEISNEDMANIVELCNQVIDLADYRGQLYDYLKARMAAIAPNLTTLVGELVGARLIAHAGSLLSLAKHPASTVQILGAEKALFRALKAKHDTPKYGLIYHASLVGQAPPKFKGKISRILAAKTSLSVRIDALRDETAANVGLTMRAQVETRLRQLEGRVLASESGKPRGAADTPRYDPSRQGAGAATVTDAAAYNPAADVTADAPGKKQKKKRLVEEITVTEPADADEDEEAAAPAAAEPQKKKKKKSKGQAQDAEAQAATDALLGDVLPPADGPLGDELGGEAGVLGPEKQKRKKKKTVAVEVAQNGQAPAAALAQAAVGATDSQAPKKKKKRKEAVS